MIRRFRDVIDACGAASVLARALGLQVTTVQKWRDRDSIPVEHWQKVMDVARENGVTVTPEQLLKLAAKNAPKLLRTNEGKRNVRRSVATGAHREA